ncbi:MAG: hypothetical protein A2W07_06875 [candidate division Zixibacteria bacterium RBG_16_43_9]|nr:MAG: hypothetical protein A2W07_06875 [candidate division Zixibacteria bacterium RBG_16_43_9]
MKVISNIHSLPTKQRNGFEIDLCKYPKSKTSFKSLVRFFFMSFKYDYILLDSTSFDLFGFAFLKLVLPFNPCKLIALDLILAKPKGLKERLKQVLKIILLKQIHLLLVYFKNTNGYQKIFRINARKFRYVPFKINCYELVLKTKISDEGYIFTGGKTRRDFQTLLKAVRDLPYPVKIVTPANDELIKHGSYLDESLLPTNIEVIHDDGSAESFIKFIAASKLVVLPIRKENISASGIGVYIMSMALKKCVIISKGPGVEDVITPEMAILVPPEDPIALKLAIERAYNDDSFRKKFEESGYSYAINLRGEERLLESIVNELKMIL